MNLLVKSLPDYLFFFAFILFSFPIIAQNVCGNGDCPSAINTLNLQVSLKIDATEGSVQSRTQQFQFVYLQVNGLKAKIARTKNWTTKYQTWALGGKDCIRLYYLEGVLAYEYEQNPAFKAFVDQSGTDIMGFKQRGFSATRKAINLLTQMDNKCPTKTRKFKKKEADLKNLPLIYQKMGIVLGYFDKNGNNLKPLTMPSQN